MAKKNNRSTAKNSSAKAAGLPLRWTNLLSEFRRKSKTAKRPTKEELRTEIERDYDRILFSSAVRRLADKTQVFPLEKNDSVRTRLTHSHEVSNLARSIGTTLAFNSQIANEVPNSKRNLPALLAATGLVHDLGNPPFGHQGEAAIQSWFKEHPSVLKNLDKKQHKQDFLKFEGNAQAFRLVTRLQLLNDDFGLDLTAATLSAMMKYPINSNETDEDHVAKKKHGFFASEAHIVEEIHQRTGLQFGIRHPLAYVMEACDDIAYVVLDAEDSIKKNLASFPDLLSFLETHAKSDPIVSEVINESREKYEQYKSQKLSPAELNDISMQRFRAFAIGHMVREVSGAFIHRCHDLLNGGISTSLIKQTNTENLRKTLKEFAYLHAYTHKSVLRVELEGYHVIRSLMDILWAAIRDRGDDHISAPRKNPFTRYVYQKISENYRRTFENPNLQDEKLPIRYRECLLLTDMISGMTDSYAMDLHKELQSLKGDFDVRNFSHET